MALTSTGHFKIGNKEFKAKSLKVGFESLNSEDSGRTDDGVMRLSWVSAELERQKLRCHPLLLRKWLNC